MAPELPAREIGRIIRERVRRGTLPVTDQAIPPAVCAKGTNACAIRGFTISAGRNECGVLDGYAHELCAVVWREESDRAGGGERTSPLIVGYREDREIFAALAADLGRENVHVILAGGPEASLKAARRAKRLCLSLAARPTTFVTCRRTPATSSVRQSRREPDRAPVETLVPQSQYRHRTRR